MDWILNMLSKITAKHKVTEGRGDGRFTSERGCTREVDISNKFSNDKVSVRKGINVSYISLALGRT